ncbi:hypothetical protein [Cellulomonas sp. JZ18]|uniref:hypothetical protein n=1 Tax=Cellulomonas sp. JZ18 TaxID=2654191 RepID=UPI0012D3EC22|nr:hypothetical protein [Cellulomonas sp. JZ18]
MHTSVRRALHTALVSGGLLVAGAAVALAAPAEGASVDLGVDLTGGVAVELDLGLVGSDHQPLVSAPVQVPAGVSGVAAGRLDGAVPAADERRTPVTGTPDGDQPGTPGADDAGTSAPAPAALAATGAEPWLLPVALLLLLAGAWLRSRAGRRRARRAAPSGVLPRQRGATDLS